MPTPTPTPNPPNRAATLGVLTPRRRQLVQLMREIGFGEIHELVVRTGDPVLVPASRILRDYKLPIRKDGRAPSFEDFALKDQVVGLFEVLDRHPNATVERIDIQDGLPFRIRFAELPSSTT